MIDTVYATGTAVLPLPGGGRAQVLKGSHWPASDPVVVAHPELFSPDPRWGMNYSIEPDGWDAAVEAVTAAPGERRGQVRKTG